MKRVLLTAVPPAERRFAEAAFADARIEEAPLAPGLVRDARLLVVAYHDRFPPPVLAELGDVRAIVTRSDGFDHLPAAWMRERGVPGHHLGDYAADSVAEHAILLLLALMRRAPEASARTREGSWSRAGLSGRSIRDATIGVLGTGHIGSRVAALVRALGGRALGHDLVRGAPVEYARDLDDLLRRSDAITIHVPLTDATRGLVGARELALLPPRAVLVNTARGEVVDARAVVAALASGALAGYAADVLPGEPAPDLAPYASDPRVLLTPHVAAYDERSIRARYARSAQIVRALLESRPAPDRCI